jgi:hypothetical protein
VREPALDQRVLDVEPTLRNRCSGRHSAALRAA